MRRTRLSDFSGLFRSFRHTHIAALLLALTMETTADIQAARDKLRQRFGDGARIGGGARMKKKAVAHKSVSGDDKKLQTAIRRMGLSNLPGVDEVAMLKDDGKALVFHLPKVQAALNANTFIITGASEEKSIDQLSAAVPEFDPEMLKKFAAEWQKMQMQEKSPATDSGAKDDDDDDVPDLVEDFEAVASESK